MPENKKEKVNLFESVAAVNDGVTKNDVKSLFVWYDLFGYALTFQIIFILVGSKYYSFTMISALFILVMDSILKNSLERDGKNYQKFSKHISLVKLWVIPLLCMGTVATIALIAVRFGLV